MVGRVPDLNGSPAVGSILAFCSLAHSTVVPFRVSIQLFIFELIDEGGSETRGTAASGDEGGSETRGAAASGDFPFECSNDFPFDFVACFALA